MNKTDLKVGQRVRCFGTHDKFTPLVGTVTGIDGDQVSVKTEEGNGSVSQVIITTAADCTLFTEAAATPKETAARPIVGTAKANPFGGAAKVSNPIR